MTQPPTLVSTVALIHNYRSVELILFETLGHWAATAPEPSVARFLGQACPKHAWHADLWSGRLPAVDTIVPPAEATLAGLERVAAAVRADASLEGATSLGRLVGAYRVLVPRTIAAYRAHRRRVDDRLDAPTARVLDLILRDEVEDWCAGEELTQSLITTVADAEHAHARQHRLEALALAP